MTDLIIAIDGPAGAGKSTVGRALAARLGLEYLDTGAMYRAVASAALRRGISVTDEEAVAELARTMSLTVSDDGVFVDGDDVTAEIRGREVTAVVSAVAANAASEPSCALASGRGPTNTAAGSSRVATSGRWSFPRRRSSCS